MAAANYNIQGTDDTTGALANLITRTAGQAVMSGETPLAIIIGLGLPYTAWVDVADVGNSGTTETDLFNKNVATYLIQDNEAIETRHGGVFVSSGTATRKLCLYLGATKVFDSGALTLSLSSAWVIEALVIRLSNTVARVITTMTTKGAALAAYTGCEEVTGLDFSSPVSFSLTGLAAGVGAASDDIVLRVGRGELKPVPLA